jgi:hypothetical protein
MQVKFLVFTKEEGSATEHRIHVHGENQAKINV